MRCPADQSEVRWIDVKHPALSRCEQCAGLWISRSGLDKLFAARGHQVPLRINLARRRGPVFSQGSRACPDDCGEHMMVATLHGIEIDACPKCGGVWFDEGELPNLLRWYGARTKPAVLKQPAGSSRPDGHPLIDLAIDGGGAALEVAAAGGDVFGGLFEAIADLLGGIFS